MLLTFVTLLLQVAPELEEGRAAVAKLEYAKAIGPLKKVVASDAPATEKAEAYGLLARSSLALGKASDAQAAFEGQLTEAPMTEEPSGAPKVKQAFLAAKKAKFPPSFLQLVRKPSSADSLVVEVVNPWRLAVTIDAWEWTGTADAQPKPVPLDGQRLVLVLAPGSKQYLRATGKDGVVLATLGSVQAPLERPPAPAVATSTTESTSTTEPPPPVRSRVEGPPPEFLPPAKATPASKPLFNPVLGWVLAGVGTAATIVGLVCIGLGLSDTAKGDGFPFTVSTLEEAERLKLQGQTEFIVGGLVGAVGVAAVVGGVLILLHDAR